MNSRDKKSTFSDDLSTLRYPSLWRWEEWVFKQYDVNAVSESGRTFLIYALAKDHGDNTEVAEFLLSDYWLSSETINKVCRVEVGEELGGGVREVTALDMAMKGNDFKPALMILKKAGCVTRMMGVFEERGIQNDTIDVVKAYAEYEKIKQDNSKIDERSFFAYRLAKAYEKIGDEDEAKKWFDKEDFGRDIAKLKDKWWRDNTISDLAKVEDPRLISIAETHLRPIAEHKTDEQKAEVSYSLKEVATANLALAQLAATRLDMDAMFARFRKVEELIQAYEKTQVAQRAQANYGAAAYAAQNNYGVQAYYRAYQLDHFGRAQVADSLIDPVFSQLIKILLEHPFGKHDAVAFSAQLSAVGLSPMTTRMAAAFVRACVLGVFNGARASIFNQAVMVNYLLSHVNSEINGPAIKAWLQEYEDVCSAIYLVTEKAPLRLNYKLNELVQNPHQPIKNPMTFILDVLHEAARYGARDSLLAELRNESIQRRIDVRVLLNYGKENALLLHKAVEWCQTAMHYRDEAGLKWLYQQLCHVALERAMNLNDLASALLVLNNQNATYQRKEEGEQKQQNDTTALVKLFVEFDSCKADAHKQKAKLYQLTCQIAEIYEKAGDKNGANAWRERNAFARALKNLSMPDQRSYGINSLMYETDPFLMQIAEEQLRPIAQYQNDESKVQAPTYAVSERFSANLAVAKFAAERFDVDAMVASFERMKKLAPSVPASELKDHPEWTRYLQLIDVLLEYPLGKKKNVMEFHQALSALDISHFNFHLFLPCLIACVHGSFKEQRTWIYYQAVLLIHYSKAYGGRWIFGDENKERVRWSASNMDLYKAIYLVLFPKEKNDEENVIADLQVLNTHPSRPIAYPVYFILRILRALATLEVSKAQSILLYLEEDSIQQRIDVRVLSKNDKENKTLLKAALEFFQTALGRLPTSKGLKKFQQKLEHEVGGAPNEEKANPQLLIIQEFGAKLMEAFRKNSPQEALHFLRQFLALRDKTNAATVDPLLISAFDSIERMKQGAADIKELIALRKQLALVIIKDAEASIAKKLFPYAESSQEVRAVCEARSKLGENDPVVRELEPRVRLFKCIEDKPLFQKIAEGARQGDLVLLHYLAHHHVYKGRLGLFGVSENPTLFLCVKIALLTTNSEAASRHTQLPLALINEMHEKAVARINQSKKKDSDFATWCARFVEAFKKDPNDLYGDQILPERVLLNAPSMPAHSDLIPAMKEALLYTPEEIEALKNTVAPQQQAVAVAAAVPAAAAAASPPKASLIHKLFQGNKKPEATEEDWGTELKDRSGQPVPLPSEADEVYRSESPSQ